MKGGDRIDDTPVHKALREALANCLINADYYGTRGVVIKKDQNQIIFENPGYIRTGKEQMRKGGESDPRNKTLMKMFNLVNIGERSGSGVPNIFNTWEDQGWKEPVIEERAKKTSEENKRRKQAKKTSEGSKIRNKTIENMVKIENYLKENGESKTNAIAEYLNLSSARTRKILSEMKTIEAIGTNTNRKYRLKDNQK